MTLPARFTDKYTVDANGCHIWAAARIHTGYGRFWADGRMVQAHRYAYENVVGPIPDGLGLDHLCRVRACVNPFHLEPVTQAENLRRSPLVGFSTPPQCGEASSRARLTDDQVRMIRQHRAGGATMAALAAEYGVAESTISFIVNGQTWRHLL